MIQKIKEKDKTSLRKAGLILLVTLLLASLLLASCGTKKDPHPPATDPPTASGSQDPKPSQDERVKAYDFSLTDQYGVSHSPEDYLGKVIFINFWATWCPPCRAELPDIESLYRDHNLNRGDLIVIGIANPDESGSGGSQREKDTEGIKEFLLENGITFPVLMDPTGEVFQKYWISGLPTTYLIDHEGYIIGYVPGAMSRAVMDHHIGSALEAMGH